MVAHVLNCGILHNSHPKSRFLLYSSQISHKQTYAHVVKADFSLKFEKPNLAELATLLKKCVNKLAQASSQSVKYNFRKRIKQINRAFAEAQVGNQSDKVYQTLDVSRKFDYETKHVPEYSKQTKKTKLISLMFPIVSYEIPFNDGKILRVVARTERESYKKKSLLQPPFILTLDPKTGFVSVNITDPKIYSITFISSDKATNVAPVQLPPAMITIKARSESNL